MMTIAYTIINCVLYILLFAVWSKDSWVNVLCKAVWLCMIVFSVILLFKMGTL